MSDVNENQPGTERGREPSGPAAGEVPNEEEVAEAFPEADDVPLREQTDLVDDDGTDIRQYTGEPVETEYGTVTPQQMVVGTERTVGGGEFPNDHRPPDDDDEPVDPSPSR
jgi:hypothetical protein